jgi:hypothetical protein
VRVVYSDESGCGSIKKEPVTVVAGIVLNLDTQWEAVEAEITVAKMGAPAHLLDKRTLKGSLLYSAMRKGISPAEEILREILSIPVRNKIPIFYGAVDRAECIQTPGAKRESPLTEYRIAFNHCLTDVDRAATTFATGERVLWIAEESDAQREMASRGGHFFHSIMKQSRFEGGAFVPSGERSSIIDTVYFGKKRHSTALQLADICCSTVTAHLQEKYYGWKKTGVGPFYDLIRHNVVTADTEPEFLGYDKIGRSSPHF